MNETDETFHEKPGSGSLALNKVLSMPQILHLISTPPHLRGHKINTWQDKNNNNKNSM